MDFVVVTGMSGSGKRTAMKMLEDAGFYCVDNLPAELIRAFGDLIANRGDDIQKVALGLDVRLDKHLSEASRILNEMKRDGMSYRILFMDASDQILIKRYKESRRLHPIEGNSLKDSIEKEREILQEIRSNADYVIDTSHLLVRELKKEIERIFIKHEQYKSLMVQIMSFGYKYGIPQEADLVYDVRFLPNPFYIDELKPLTGNDAPVRDYVMQFKEAGEFLKMLSDMLRFLIPEYIKEGKQRLMICVGCTGGRHRSVTLANALYEELKDDKAIGVTIMHRDAVRATE
ncbi:MAG TPA: RNase adapter RapZ [Lachnospiraceae bacterium]|nr:RNase adapter RapZ [Lachnospiraceae bacterium]